jgi:hypothetical protein
MKPNSVVLEYVRGLLDEDLSELRMRFHQDLAGDKATICEMLAANKELDRWLQKATGADDLFNMLDQIGEAVMREYNRRDAQRPDTRKK